MIRRINSVNLEAKCSSFSPPSLEDLCLKTTIHNFHIYSLAFYTTKNEFTMRMIEFLQRKYSTNILLYFNERIFLQEAYLDILINKYLRILESVWIRNYSWKKLTFKMAEIGSSIEELTIMHEHLGRSCDDRPWHKIMCYFPNLKSITLDDINDCCYGSILKSIAISCPNIEEIDFHNGYVSFEVAKNFFKNENGTKLKRLCIGSSCGRVDGLKYFLKNFKTLEIINNPDVPLLLYSLHKADLSTFDKMQPYNIRRLSFIPCTHCPFLDEILKVCLSVCPHLKSVTCGLVKELEFFPCLPELEELIIINFKDTSKININSLFKSKKENLTSLKIVNCTLSVFILPESCPHLKELILKEVNLSFHDDSKPLFNSLSSCTFESINLSVNAKAINLFLSAANRLQSLSFRRCSMLSSDVEMNILKYCKTCSLKKISFCYSYIEKEFLKNLLLNCTTLKHIDIVACFDSDNEGELLKFTEILPNKPEISFLDSDYEEIYDYSCDMYEVD